MNHKVYILNAISLNLSNSNKIDFFMTKSTLEDVSSWCIGKEVVSAVRHGLQFIAKEIAKNAYLFKEISEIKFSKGAYDVVVIQYKGPRLPEGAVSLPSNAKLEVWEGIVRVY